MSIPTFLLGLIISLLIGALFHLWRGGGLGRLAGYLLFSIAGFFGGNWIGNWRGWILFPIGALDLGVALLASLILLMLVHWLSLVRLHGTGQEDDAV